MAHGDYIFFIDSDDYILDNCVERLLEVAVSEHADIVKCSWVEGSESDYNVRPEKTGFSVYSNVSAFRTREVNIAIHGKLYRKEVIDNYRYPKVTTHDDEFLTYKLIYNAPKIVVLNEAYYYYFKNPNSIMRGKRSKQPLQYIDAYQERIAFFEQKNEEELTGISHKEYAIRLMLSYLSYSKYKTSDLSLKELFEKYCDEYRVGFRYANTFWEKVSLMLFRRFPGVFKIVIGR